MTCGKDCKCKTEEASAGEWIKDALIRPVTSGGITQTLSDYDKVSIRRDIILGLIKSNTSAPPAQLVAIAEIYANSIFKDVK
jgi:hypothetical protein